MAVMREPIYLDTELTAINDVMAYYDEAAEADIEPPKNYGEKAAAIYIEREKAHRRAQHVNKAALNPDLCRIVYLGVWWPQFTTPALMQCIDESAERDALAQWWDGYGEGEMICGFNVRAFDLAMICRRSLYLDVPTKYINRDRYRSTCIIDLMEMLSEGRKDHMRSLNWYIRRFKLDVPKDPVDGAQIPALVAAGDWLAVRNHLRCDLHKVRALAQRIVPRLQTREAMA